MRATPRWVIVLLLLAAAGSTLTVAPRPAAAQFDLQDPTAGEDPPVAGDDASDEADDEERWDEDEGEVEGVEDEDEPADPPEAAPGSATEDHSDHEHASDASEDEADEEEDDREPSGYTTTFGPAITHPEPTDSRFLLPPLLLERQGQRSTTAVFPFFYLREEPDDHTLVIPPYYQRRSLDLHADAIFPVFFSFRGTDSRTLVIPPLYHHTDTNGFDWGVAPLIFTGRGDDAAYTIIPPLLAVTWADDDNAYTFAGGLFWRVRDELDVKWGLFPLLWVFDDEEDAATIAAPFFFRFADLEADSATTIVPPVYHHTSPEETWWGVAPLLHHYHDAEGFSLTLPPLLFHYGRDGDNTRLVTPLLGYFDVDGAATLVTPLYQSHRGDTYLDAVSPLFYWWRDHRKHATSLVLPPLLFYHYDDPGESTTIAGPLFGLWRERGRYSTWATLLAAHYESEVDTTASTWIFPTFQFSHTPTSRTFNLHPLIYSTNADTYRHLVIAPIWWDFDDYEDDTRATVAFPFVWRFRSGASVDQIAFNTYYSHFRRRGIPGWEFHFFPFFAYGSPRPGDHWWSILYGLAGYQRQGAYAQGRAFWIPFETDSPEN